MPLFAFIFYQRRKWSVLTPRFYRSVTDKTQKWQCPKRGQRGLGWGLLLWHVSSAGKNEIPVRDGESQTRELSPEEVAWVDHRDRHLDGHLCAFLEGKAVSVPNVCFSHVVSHIDLAVRLMHCVSDGEARHGQNHYPTVRRRLPAV